MLLLVVIDGLVMDKITIPMFQFLTKKFISRWSLDTKVAYPPLTEPSFASMLHGVDPTMLDVYFDDEEDYGTWVGYPGWVKSVFQILSEAKHSSAICGGWRGLAEEVVKPGYAEDLTQQNEEKDVDKDTAIRAMEQIKARKHDLFLVYFEEADHVAHEHGIGEEYYRTVKKIAKKLDSLLSLLRPKTDVFIVTSDHGRQASDGGKSHFEYTRLTTQVPLFVHLPKDKNSSHFHAPTATMDIMPSILSHFHVPIPSWVRGRPLW